MDTLRQHRTAQELERAEATSWHDAGLVFTTSKGTMIEPRNLNRFLDEAIARAGLRRIRFHDLRHTCASLLLAQGVSPRVVMEVLGHSQMSMTTDLYGHVMPSALRSAADALDGVFG
nr:tyrosine-type recombinase/integrase [Janibacter terrae]